MAIDIVHNPPALSFSANHINVVFNCLDYLDQTGVYAVNTISFATMPAENSVINIEYGQTTIAMTAKSAFNNDFSGNNFVNIDVDSVLWSFKANYKLSEDFIITLVGTDLVFTAKKKGPQYNFISGGTNTTAGKTDILKPNYSVYFRLYIENENYTGFKELYSTNVPLIPGSNGKAEAIIGDKLHVEMSNSLRQGFPDQPSGATLMCKRSCRKYYFEFAECYGSNPKPRALQVSDTYTVIHGGLSTLAEFKTAILNLINPSSAENDKFLKQGHSIVATRSNQPNYLFFFNSRSTKAVKLTIKYTYTDGSTYTQEKEEFEMLTGRKYGFETRFDQLYDNFSPGKTVKHYEVYLMNGAVRVSEIRTYILDYTPRNQIRYFLYWSSFGSLDSLACYGRGESEFELFSKTASRQYKRGDNIKAGKSLTYNSRIKRSFKVATGFMTASQIQLNADFFLSSLKYRYTGGNMLPIEVLPGKIPELADGGNLHAQTFDYKYHYDDHSFTEGDAEETGVSISGFFFSSVVGTSPSDVFEETDPTVPQHVKNIREEDIVRWNSSGLINLSNYFTKTQSDNRFAKIDDDRINNGASAFNWGNHAGLYQEKENQRLGTANNVVFNSAELTTKLSIPHNLGSSRKVTISAATDGSGGVTPPPPVTSITWADIVGTISDSVALTEALNGKVDILGYNKTNWDNAFANNHTHANKYTLDLITSAKISNWDLAYLWGNHSGLYQEKENQRLSTTNNVIFNSVELTTKLSIPHNLGSSRKVSIIAATDGSGGVTPPPPLTDVSWGMITGTLSSQTDLMTALNGKAAINGVNATGTWGINITGSAGNAVQWNGYTNNFTTDETNPDGVIVYKSGVIKYTSYASIRGWLGLNDGSTLTNNITGNATTATRAIALGNSAGTIVDAYGGTVESAGLSVFLGIHSTGGIYKFTHASAKSALGLNDGSTLINNITGNAYSSTYVANGVYTIGNQSIDGIKTFLNTIVSKGFNFTNGSSGAVGVVTSDSSFYAIGTGYAYGVSTNNAYGGLDIMANQAGADIRFWSGTINSSPTLRYTILANGNHNFTGNGNFSNNITTNFDLFLSGTRNHTIQFASASSWFYSLSSSSNDFRIYDALGDDFIKLNYNGGGANRYTWINSLVSPKIEATTKLYIPHNLGSTRKVSISAAI